MTSDSAVDLSLSGSFASCVNLPNDVILRSVQFRSYLTEQNVPNDVHLPVSPKNEIPPVSRSGLCRLCRLCPCQVTSLGAVNVSFGGLFPIFGLGVCVKAIQRALECEKYEDVNPVPLAPS